MFSLINHYQMCVFLVTRVYNIIFNFHIKSYTIIIALLDKHIILYVFKLKNNFRIIIKKHIF